MANTDGLLGGLWDIIKKESGKDDSQVEKGIEDAIVKLDWENKDKHAILLVHGIGNAKPEDYNGLIDSLYEILGSGDITKGQAKYQIYLPYYDFINDWFKDKYNFIGSGLDSFKNFLTSEVLELNDTNKEIMEKVGDVIWQVFSPAARNSVQLFFIAQMNRILLDSIETGAKNEAENTPVSIICHSMGCFHIYEFLHNVFNNSQYRLHPHTDRIWYRNVIFMASPLQMIKYLTCQIPSLIPDGLAIHKSNTLFLPTFQPSNRRLAKRTSAERLVAITGTMDPVGGYWFGNKVDNLYMDINHIDTNSSKVDKQNRINQQSLLTESLIIKGINNPGSIKINNVVENPHSWESYTKKYAQDLKGWLS